MRHQDQKSFNERRQDAAEAKKKLLKKFETAPKPNDPEAVARRAEREAIATAREQRRTERERLRKEEHDREIAESAARAEAAEAEANAEAAAREAAERNRIARVISDEAERKAERDRRYAARKARKR